MRSVNNELHFYENNDFSKHNSTGVRTSNDSDLLTPCYMLKVCDTISMLAAISSIAAVLLLVLPDCIFSRHYCQQTSHAESF